MATGEELRAIYKEATTYAVPATPTANEIAAHALMDRIIAYAWKRASDIMDGADSNPDLRNLKIAHRIAGGESEALGRELLIYLLGSTGAASLTPDQIRARTEAEIATALQPFVPQLAQVMVMPR